MATINLNPTSGIDDAWRTRVPQGWIQFPDGSFGPPNQVGSDWNAPYRQSPMPSGGSIQIGGGGKPIPINDPTGVSGGNLAGPGGTTINTNPDPDIIPPSSRPINPTRQVGPFTGGTSTENGGFRNPFTNPYTNPQTGQPEILNPEGGVTSGGKPVGGGFNPLTMFGGNPLWRGIIAAGGIMQPTPAETGTLDNRPDLWPKRGGGGIGSDANFPVRGVGGDPMTWQSPGQQLAPSDQSGAGGGGKGGGGKGGGRGRISPGTVNLGRGVPRTATAQAPNTSPFIGIERQNAPATQGQPGRGYQTALDLSGLFGHPAIAAAAAAHPTVQAHVAARVAGPLAARQPSTQMAPLPPVRVERFPSVREAGDTSLGQRLTNDPNIKSYRM